MDGNAATNGNGLTPTTPRQKIQDAINHATGGDNRGYVRIATAMYNETVGVSNGAMIYLVGADGATISPNAGDPIGSFSGSSMTVRNVIMTAPSGNAANCQNASLTAYRSQFVNSSQSGIYALNCTLSVDASWIDNNKTGGIYVSGGNLQVINSILTRNIDSGGLYQVATATNAVFANNTVADNTASGSYAGVMCAATSALVVRNSILFNNKSGGGVVSETNCMSAVVASDDPAAGPQSAVDLTMQTPGFKDTTPKSADSYHVLATSACLDRASSLYSTDHDFDFEPRPDVKSSMPDIGADELQQ